MENLDEQLKNADALQHKTPSPAVWARIEARLATQEHTPLQKFGKSAVWLRIAAAFAAVVILTAIYILIQDNLGRDNTWLACADCTEWLRDENPYFSLPVAVSARSLYLRTSLAANNNGFRADVRRLSYDGFTGQASLLDVVAKQSPKSLESELVYAISWRSGVDQSQSFNDDISIAGNGTLYWQRQVAGSHPAIIATGTLYETGLHRIEVVTDSQEFTTSGVIKGQFIYIDMRVYDGKIYRWRMPQNDKVLFTGIIPLYSYTGINSGSSLRLAEHNVLCSVY